MFTEKFSLRMLFTHPHGYVPWIFAVLGGGSGRGLGCWFTFQRKQIMRMNEILKDQPVTKEENIPNAWYISGAQ